MIKPLTYTKEEIEVRTQEAGYLINSGLSQLIYRSLRDDTVHLNENFLPKRVSGDERLWEVFNRCIFQTPFTFEKIVEITRKFGHESVGDQEKIMWDELSIARITDTSYSVRHISSQ